MLKLRIHTFAISLDGYGAGPDQSADHPLGKGGTALGEWLYPTRTFQRMLFGKDAGTTGIDDGFAARGLDHIGAWILGRNMFGPVRGPWPDHSWKGWWGDNPPYHVPVFVLTHHARPPLAMEGGTVFHFLNGGIEAVLGRAKAAANGRDVRLGGGVATIRQYLSAGLVDEAHFVVTPALLGSGEAVFTGLDLCRLGYEVSEHVTSEKATHVVLTKRL